ncbi:S66 family peptidase [Stackebrandtia albiflava]|uniref:S66 family peptidase n=1 Tax=Stackebrandtia albiflava TaxID=406432 RepID=UPI001FCEC7E2|nr:S66 peptidase family protein [Stackebrandtia albiflava]
MIIHRRPPKPSPGDHVALVSPSSGLPGILPLPFELGSRRIAEDFGLIPVEYPTTRRMNAAPADRAADLHAAFSDPRIKAVICSIGGDDLITVLPHLDPEVFRAHPKPFFGYSDSTVMHAYLSRLGIASYYGGAVMTDFGRGGRIHPEVERSLRAALFQSGEYELLPETDIAEVDRDWADPASLETEPDTTPTGGWRWHHADRVVTGTGWGGCLEVVSWMLMADKAVPATADLTGAVLFFETTEELPPAVEVYRMLRNMGERGWLAACGALLMGRPKCWSFDHLNDEAARARYLADQNAAVMRAMTEYAPETPVVLNVNFGHTDPNLVLPYSGPIRVDGPARRLTVTY